MAGPGVLGSFKKLCDFVAIWLWSRQGKERRAAERQAAEETKDVCNFKNIAEGSFKKEKDMMEEVIEGIELKVEADDKCINGDVKLKLFRKSFSEHLITRMLRKQILPDT